MPEGARTDGRSEIRALTGIRAAAAVWVVFFHLENYDLYSAYPFLEALRPAIHAGYLGVDLFFILSGFILTWTYAPAFPSVRWTGWRDFAVARIARIYPVHVATLAFIAAVLVAGKLGLVESPWRGERYRAADAAAHLALVHAWRPGAALTWNSPSWSISAEWFAYLWFPFTCALWLKLRRPWLAVALAMAALAATAPAIRATGLGDGLDVADAGALVRIAFEFVAGCLLCRAFATLPDELTRLTPAVRSMTMPGGTADLVAAASAAGIVALAVVGLADPWALPLFGTLVLGLARADGPLARLFASRPLVFWGRVSYSLYMVHWIVFRMLAVWVHKHLDPDPGAWSRKVIVVVYPLAAAGAAVLLWRFVEEPWRRRIRDWAARGKKPAPMAA